jgi:two-component system phosphate regulon response regulator PhoB
MGNLHGAEYVLVVEDDNTLRQVMTWVLEAEGLRVKAAGTCDEARALIAEERPGLVLLDYLIEAGTCEALIHKDGFIDGTPVILVTGINKAEDIAERLHVSGLVKKPFQPECLTSLVKSSLQRS